MTNPALSLASALLKRRRAITLLVAALAGLGTLIAGIGVPLDHALQTARFAVRSHAASGDIGLVEIDARSLQAVGRWPWPRGLHARAVDVLRRAGARLVAFDVDFSGHGSVAGDGQLARALVRSGGGVVLPAFRQASALGARDTIDSMLIPALRDQAIIAAVNIVPDRDGIVRQAPTGVIVAGEPRPSMPAMLAGFHGRSGESFPIDFAIDPATIPRISFIDLIEGRVPPGALAGKTILIGATGIEMGDRYTVPRDGVLPGAVLQVIAAESLSGGRTPVTYGGFLPFLMAMMSVAALAARRTRLARGAAVSAGFAILLAGPVLTERFLATSFEIAPALAALGLGCLASAGFVLLRSFLRRTLTDGETGLPSLVALEQDCEGKKLFAVARLDRFSAIAAGLGSGRTADLVTRVAERLSVGTGGAAIHRVDEAVLGWACVGDPDELVGQIEGLAALMRSPVEVGGRTIDVVATFGIADGDSEVRQLVAAATLAAERARADGVRWRRFDRGDATDETDWHLSMLGELDDAMATGALWIAYQPKLAIATGQVIGAEALVRWQHPVRGPVSPDVFIPLIESLGRAEELTRFVLDGAVAQAATWARQGHALGVAVNISAPLLQQLDIEATVRDVLARHDVPAHRLTLEVTESAALGDPEAVIPTLAALRAAGIRISIDDYGTGQSTLTYLKRLPADELKIDKSFVQDLMRETSSALLVESTIALAHGLGLKVVAEGVEDAACLARLAELGCDIAQGYHIGKPARGDAMTSSMARPVSLAA